MINFVNTIFFNRLILELILINRNLENDIYSDMFNYLKKKVNATHFNVVFLIFIP